MMIMTATVDSPGLGGECGPGGGVVETEDRERLCLSTPTSPLSPDITHHMALWREQWDHPGHHPHPYPPIMEFNRW